MMDIQTFYKERESLQSSEKFHFKWPLRYPQFECIKKGVEVFQNSREYFLDCVPRFGKTSAGYYLSLNIIKSNIVVIFTGVTTKSEWEKEIKSNFNVPNLKFYSDNEVLKSMDIDNLDPNYTHVFYCNLMLMERNGDVETKLLSGLSKYKVTYILDEVHHFVGSENVQKYISLIRQCNNHYLVLLTGTAYTDFCRSFKEENIYRCTYEDTWNYKRAGLIDYCLPKLHLTIPTELASILNKKKYDYLKLWKDNSKSKEAIKIILKSIKAIYKKKEELHNFLIVCNSQEECDELNSHLLKLDGCTSRVVYGGAKDTEGREWNSESVDNYLKENPSNYNFLLTCSKFCTGSTIRELQGVLFLCSTTSAIKFVQASFRCTSPYDDGREKTDAYIFCFEKYTAFEILPRIYNGTQLIPNKKYLKRIKQDIDIKILDENFSLKEISFSDVTRFEDNFVKNRDNLKNGIEVLDNKDEVLSKLLNDYNWMFGNIKTLTIKEGVPKGNSNKKYDTSNMKSPNSKQEKEPDNSKTDSSSTHLINLIQNSLIEVLESLTDKDLIYPRDNSISFREDALDTTKDILDVYGFPLEALKFIRENLPILCFRVVKNRLSKLGEYND